MILKVYMASSTILFIFLALVWDRKTWLNILMKFIFVALTLLGLLNLLILDGYIIHV